MDEAVVQQQAAETLRAVEGMRRRTIAVGSRASTFPLIAFGLAALAAAGFGLLSGPKTVGFTRDLGGGVTEGSATMCAGPGCDSKLHVLTTVGIFLSLLVAFIATEIHYRRQAVHPASQPKRQISVVQAIIIAALLIVFGQFILGALFFAITMPFITGAGTMFFLLYTIAAIVQGKRIRNDALSWAGAFGFVSVGVAPFIWADYETTIAALLYAATFLGAAGLVRLKRVRAA